MGFYAGCGESRQGTATCHQEICAENAAICAGYESHDLANDRHVHGPCHDGGGCACDRALGHHPRCPHWTGAETGYHDVGCHEGCQHEVCQEQQVARESVPVG